MKQSKIISTIAKNWDKAREEKRMSSYTVRAFDFGFKRFVVAKNNYCERAYEAFHIPSRTHYFTIKI